MATDMKKRGTKFSMDATELGPSTIAMFGDPDGNIFWLGQGVPKALVCRIQVGEGHRNLQRTAEPQVVAL